MSELDQDNLFDQDPDTSKSSVVTIQIDERLTMLAQLLAMGKSIADTALELQRSEAWVRAHKKDPIVKDIIKSLQSEALESAKTMITHSAIKAAGALNALLDDPNPGIKLAAANSVLDRNGLRPPEKGGMVNVQVNISTEERKQKLAARMERMKADE